MGNQTKQFKGFDDFIEIFEGGEQTDSRGNTKTWSESELDSIIANFNKETSAPAVVGHPKHDAPAYGWVESLKREGLKLYAKFHQIESKFEDMVKKGRFRKRSVAIDPVKDGEGYTLRHVGWLGATAPAVDGLKDVEFSDAEAEFTFESDWYTPNVLTRMMRRMREFIVEHHGVDAANKVIPDYEIESISEHAVTLQNEPEDNPQFSQDEPEGEPPVTKQFTQEELDAAVDAAKNEQAAEFQASQEEADNKLNEERNKRLTAEFQKQIDEKIDAGCLLPAQTEGLAEFMASLSDEEEYAIEFSCGEEENVKLSPSAFFSDFLDSLKKQIDVGGEADIDNVDDSSSSNFSKPDNSVVDADRMKLHEKALQYQKENPDKSYIEAVQAVGG